MAKQLISVDIDSDAKHVKSDIDRVDAILTVPTGPMDHQEVSYHLIEEERQSLPDIQPINKASKEKSSSKSRFIDSEGSDDFPKDPPLNQGMQPTTSNDDNQTARFSLPEIDSSIQQDKKYQIKKVNKSSKSIHKEQQSIVNPPTYTIEDEQHHESSSSVFNVSTLEIPEPRRPRVNNTLQHQAERLLPFYTLRELAQHNDSTDAWICIFGHIYTITSLIQQIQGTSAYQQLIDYAGQDISSWFDEQTHEPRQRIDPQTHETVLLIKNFSVIERLGPPFWKTQALLIGRLTEHSRYIRLLHDFSPKHPYVLEVAEEETIGQIAQKFLKSNAHIFSYIWRYHGRILDFNQTLTENGIPNEEFFHDKYGWRSDNENCPTIILSFADDLTIA